MLKLNLHSKLFILMFNELEYYVLTLKERNDGKKSVIQVPGYFIGE